jgi:hypothetical protein
LPLLLILWPRLCCHAAILERLLRFQVATEQPAVEDDRDGIHFDDQVAVRLFQQVATGDITLFFLSGGLVFILLGARS